MKKGWKLAGAFALDLVLIGALLLTYAYFHHVMPVVYDPSGYGTANIDPNDLPDFSQSFPDKFFTDDTVVHTPTSYKSKNVNVTVSTVAKDNLCYYVADIYLRNVSFLKTAFAGGSFSRSVTQRVEDMADRLGAIVATNGDHYGFRDRGQVIRNGVVYRSTKCYAVCALYLDGTLETYSAAEFDPQRAVAGGVYQTWDFGPALLDDRGKAIEEFHSGIAGKNPRCAIGYYQPGHYCLVLVDGRQEGYSMGMTLTELAQLFEDMGCRAAYNLDGGQSANMAWGGQLVNIPTRGGREVSDLIYICDTLSKESQ